MTKQQFIQEGFHTLLGIENKKFDLPQKSLINLGKTDCHVRISLKGAEVIISSDFGVIEAFLIMFFFFSISTIVRYF